MLDLNSLTARLAAMSQQEIEDMVLSAMHNAGIEFSDGDSGRGIDELFLMSRIDSDSIKTQSVQPLEQASFSVTIQTNSDFSNDMTYAA